jgi:hypothetical protein
MRTPAGPLLKYSLRALIAWGLIAAAGFVFADSIVGVFLPAMEGVIDALQSDFTAYLSVAEVRGNSVIVMSCTAARPLALPSGKIVPFLGSFKCASIDTVHALVPIVVYAAAVAAWPISRWREVYRRLLGSLFLVPVVVSLTTPLLLVGLADTSLYPENFQSDKQLTALLQPFVFLESGGNWLLPLMAAVVCVRIAGRRAPPVRSI